MQLKQVPSHGLIALNLSKLFVCCTASCYILLNHLFRNHFYRGFILRAVTQNANDYGDNL